MIKHEKIHAASGTLVWGKWGGVNDLKGDGPRSVKSEVTTSKLARALESIQDGIGISTVLNDCYLQGFLYHYLPVNSKKESP